MKAVRTIAISALACLAAGVIAEASAEASEARRSKKSTKSKKSKRQKKSPARSARAATADNMPDGFRWPPTDHMKSVGEACKAKLTELAVEFEDAEVQKKVPTPITVASLEFGGVKLVSRFRKPPFVMDCHLAVAFTEHLGKLYDLGVREIHFGSIYRYTKVRAGGRTKNALSRHALGMAIDMYTFVDADGKETDIKQDYRSGNKLLRDIEDTVNATGAFRKVVSPKNDPVSHSDHFHIEARANYSKPTS